jgi:hypothetical protein
MNSAGPEFVNKNYYFKKIKYLYCISLFKCSRDVITNSIGISSGTSNTLTASVV